MEVIMADLIEQSRASIARLNDELNAAIDRCINIYKQDIQAEAHHQSNTLRPAVPDTEPSDGVSNIIEFKDKKYKEGGLPLGISPSYVLHKTNLCETMNSRLWEFRSLITHNYYVPCLGSVKKKKKKQLRTVWLIVNNNITTHRVQWTPILSIKE